MSEKQANPPTGKRSAKKGWLFLAATCVGYGLVYLLFPEFGRKGVHRFGQMALELMPIFVLVFVFLWLTELFSGATAMLARLTGHGSGLRGWLVAIVAGVLSHGPIYPWYPLLRNMRDQGMRPALVAAFLYARSIKLPWLPLMAFYFGTAYMVVLTGWILVFSVLHGWLVERITGRGQ